MASQDHGIHSCEECVITFSRLWEENTQEEEAREDKVGAIEDQALTIQRRSLKR